jgi:hypothetical protein
MINVPPDWEDTLMCDMNCGTLSTSYNSLASLEALGVDGTVARNMEAYTSA